MSLIKVEEALFLLERENVVGMPTETVYGLAGNILSEKALQQIFKIKERPFFDPLIVHVDSVEKLKSHTTEWNEIYELLSSKLMPGPLTLIAPKRPHINSLITSGLSSVGLRIPKHPLALKMISPFAGLAAPSANKFGQTSPTKALHVLQEFQNEVHVVDGGDSVVGIESTVVELIKQTQWTLRIYRPGHYSKSMLENFLKENGQNILVEYAQSPVAPGQIKHHYQPKLPLHVYRVSNQEKVSSNTWKMPNDPIIVARELYQRMRDLDQNQAKEIIFLLPEVDLNDEWQGILNRLQKAASYFNIGN